MLLDQQSDQDTGINDYKGSKQYLFLICKQLEILIFLSYEIKARSLASYAKKNIEQIFNDGIQ